MRVHAEQCGHARIAPSADLQRFQACEQPSQSLIEKTEEQDNGGFHLVLEHFPRDAPNGNLRNLAAGADLPLPLLLLQGEVDESSAEPLSLDQPPMNQVQEALSRLDMQRVVQLAGRESCGRVLHKTSAGVKQCAVSGEPDAAMRPQATRIELAGRAQGVVLCASGERA